MRIHNPHVYKENARVILWSVFYMAFYMDLVAFNVTIKAEVTPTLILIKELEDQLMLSLKGYERNWLKKVWPQGGWLLQPLVGS